MPLAYLSFWMLSLTVAGCLKPVRQVVGPRVTNNPNLGTDSAPAGFFFSHPVLGHALDFSSHLHLFMDLRLWL